MGAVLWMKLQNIKSPYDSRCGTIKIPPCSEAESAEHHRPTFCSPLLAMVQAKYSHRDVTQQTYVKTSFDMVPQSCLFFFFLDFQ